MKKIVKTVLSAAAIIAVAAVPLSGCKSTAEKTNSDKKIITIWTNSRHDMDMRQQQIDKFNKENDKKIFIDYQVKSDDFADALKISYQSKTAPDIHPSCSIDTGAIENGWYRKLDDETVKFFNDKMAFEAVSVAKTSKGEKYPFTVKTGGITSYRLVWDKDLFKESGLDPEKPPKTWQELEEYAEQITSKGKGKKYGFALPLKDDAFIDYYVLTPGAPSGLCNVRGYDPVHGQYDFSIYAKMIDLYKRMDKKGLLFPSPDTLDNDTARAQFSEGNVGMMMAAFWDVGVFNDQFPAKVDWGAANIPTFDGKIVGGNPASVSSATSYVMNAASKYPDEQLEVYKWFNSEEVLRELQLAGKGTYGYKSLMDPSLINTDKKGAKEFYSVNNPAFFMDGSNAKLPSFTLQLDGDGYLKTMANIIKADLDTESTLADLTKRYNRSLNEWIDKEHPAEEDYITPGWTGVVNIGE